jgi:hypothetical protein
MNLASTSATPGAPGGLSPAAASKRRSYAPALLVLHFIAFAYGMAEDDLVAGLATASSALFATLWYAIGRRRLAGMSLATGFIAGIVIVFGYGNYGYVRLTDLPQGLFPELTTWLGATMAWLAALGAVSFDLVLGAERKIARSELARQWQTLLLAALLFVIVATVLVLHGYFSSRWIHDTKENAFGAEYFVYGLGPMIYIVFFVLGARMQAVLLSPANTIVLGMVAMLAFVQSLSGGREASLTMGAYFLLGTSASALSARSRTTLALGMAAAGALLIVTVGFARGAGDFADSSLQERASAVGQATGARTGDTGEHTFLEGIVGRIFETSAQIVIDSTVATGRYAGFDRVERLRFVLIPKFLAPEKLGVDDGTEILRRDYGYMLDDFTGVPMTLVADAFRRGGWEWVCVVGLIAGAWLRILARLTVNVVGGEFGALALGSLSVIYLRAYPCTVWGLVHFTTYLWMRQVLLLIAFLWVTRLFIVLTQPRTSAVQA